MPVEQQMMGKMMTLLPLAMEIAGAVFAKYGFAAQGGVMTAGMQLKGHAAAAAAAGNPDMQARVRGLAIATPPV